MKANEQLVLDMFRAVEERDVARILEIYDPDVEFVWPGSVQTTEEARQIHPRVIASNDVEVVVRTG